MQTIYKISGGAAARCSCGHRKKLREFSYLIDTGGRMYTLCEKCGKERGMHQWWGAKKEITVEEMERMWFGGEKVKEVICRRLPQYTKRLGNSQKREEMLKVAVDV